jgi:hypothetical protein
MINHVINPEEYKNLLTSGNIQNFADAYLFINESIYDPELPPAPDSPYTTFESSIIIGWRSEFKPYTHFNHKVMKTAHFHGCGLTTIGEKARFGKELIIEDCPIEHLPDNVSNTDYLHLKNCPNIKTFHLTKELDCTLRIENCPILEHAYIDTHQKVYIENCEELESIQGIFRESLAITNCNATIENLTAFEDIEIIHDGTHPKFGKDVVIHKHLSILSPDKTTSWPSYVPIIHAINADLQDQVIMGLASENNHKYILEIFPTMKELEDYKQRSYAGYPNIPPIINTCIQLLKNKSQLQAMLSEIPNTLT